MSALTQELSDLAGSWIVHESILSVPTGPNALQVAPADPLRWAILFFLGVPGAAANITISTLANVSVSGGGIILSTSQQSLQLSYRHWGALVQQPWYAISQAAGTLLDVILVRGQQ